MCYAKELKEGFVEYTEQVVKLMVPLLKFYFHDDILLMGGLATCWTSCALLKTVVGWAVCGRSQWDCGWSLTVLSTCAGGSSRVHAPATGVCAGTRPRLSHTDVALHVRRPHQGHWHRARLGCPIRNHAFVCQGNQPPSHMCSDYIVCRM